MNEAQIDALDADDEFYMDLGSGIWLMDNHKWAFYIWHKHQAESGIEKFSLVHADYHWDGGNDFHESPEKLEELLRADDDELFGLIREELFIRWDSFISPAILRGFIDEVHFYCKQGDEYDVGLDEELLERAGTKQFIHDDARDLSIQTFSSPLIFDLCLDLFNKSKRWYESDIWPDREVREFLDITRPLVRQAVLVTVSLSFGYSGTVEDTRRLAKLVLPMLKQWRR